MIIFFQMWYVLKDLVMAWDLLIYTTKEHQRKQNINEIETHNQNLTDITYHNEVLWPFSRLRHKEKEGQVKTKNNPTLRSQSIERKKIYMIKENISKKQFNLCEEETYKYDLVDVTRELLQVRHWNFVLVSCCILF